MITLPLIPSTPKSGSEQITNDGTSTGYSILDFWRWSVSDILSNATRGRFAEFLVGTAVGLKPEALRDEWDAYDLTSDTGIKIEVKSAAYIQSWRQDNYSKITFSIREAKFWDANNENVRAVAKRHADVYEFCLLKHLDQETINPLQAEQWEFYVVPTSVLNSYTGGTCMSGLNSLRKMAVAVAYNGLKKAVEDANFLK